MSRFLKAKFRSIVTEIYIPIYSNSKLINNFFKQQKNCQNQGGVISQTELYGHKVFVKIY